MPAAQVGARSSFTTVQFFNQTEQALVDILHSTLGPNMEEKKGTLRCQYLQLTKYTLQ